MKTTTSLQYGIIIIINKNNNNNNNINNNNINISYMEILLNIILMLKGIENKKNIITFLINVL